MQKNDESIQTKGQCRSVAVERIMVSDCVNVCLALCPLSCLCLSESLECDRQWKETGFVQNSNKKVERAMRDPQSLIRRCTSLARGLSREDTHVCVDNIRAATGNGPEKKETAAQS